MSRPGPGRKAPSSAGRRDLSVTRCPHGVGREEHGATRREPYRFGGRSRLRALPDRRPGPGPLLCRIADIPHFPGYPPMVGVRCHNRSCVRMSPVSEASWARNVAMPWPPRIQSVQVQGFKMQKVMRSIHRFGQLTWSSPGGGPRARATGPDREHGGSRGRGTMPRIARKPARPLEGVSSPQLHCLGQSFTPLVTRLIGGILGVAVMRG